MNERLYHIVALLLLSAILVCLGGCSVEDVTPPDRQSASIVFAPYLQSSREGTRATYPAGSGGTMNLTRLKEKGFGVFAQYTAAEIWSAYTNTEDTPFNFMWNQQVDWTEGSSAWTYSPVKYWPNDNQLADNQGAQGSQEHSYLSFFAYAPYTAVDTPGSGFSVKNDANSDGIVAVTANNTNASASYIYYRTSLENPFDTNESVDLLWAKATDRYKTDAEGYGYVSGRVPLVFKHAQALFTIAVQGLFDHKDNSDASTTYPADRDPFTKILIESVDFSGSPLFTEGTLYPAVASTQDATLPHWVLNEEDANSDGTKDHQANIVIANEDINLTFANRYLDGTWQTYWDESDMSQGLLKETDVDVSGAYDAGDALELFNRLPTGVSHTEVPLDYTNWDPAANDSAGAFEYKYRMVLPNDEYRAAHSDEKMTVRMVYYVITYDERLTLVKTNRPRYFSIVKNDITATFDTFSFAPNKKYKLLLQPGLTTAKFTVTMVDGWDTPLTLDPEVVDWYTKATELEVE